MSESLSPSSDLTASEAPSFDPIVPGIPGAGTTFWTDERLALLRELQAKKWSGSRIAAELGVTRNTVMGKLNRLGFKCESMYQPPRGEGRKREQERKAHPWTPLPHPEEPIPATACSIYDLTTETCRWPVGPDTGRGQLFCGAPGADLAAGIPYCGNCAPRAFTQARWRP